VPDRRQPKSANCLEPFTPRGLRLLQASLQAIISAANHWPPWLACGGDLVSANGPGFLPSARLCQAPSSDAEIRGEDWLAWDSPLLLAEGPSLALAVDLKNEGQARSPPTSKSFLAKRRKDLFSLWILAS